MSIQEEIAVRIVAALLSTAFGLSVLAWLDYRAFNREWRKRVEKWLGRELCQ